MSNLTVCPPNYARIMRDVIESLPVWVLELPPESYVAEVSSRIILHPSTKDFTQGDPHLCEVIQSEFEKVLMEKVKQTRRYKENYGDSKNE